MTTAKTTTNFVELVLSCGSWQEAQNIADHLLDQKLIACAKFLPIKSKYWWEGELESAKEVVVMMESAAHHFTAIEAEIKKLHSYKTFVLKALPIERLSADAGAWMRDELKLTD